MRLVTTRTSKAHNKAIRDMLKEKIECTGIEVSTFEVDIGHYLTRAIFYRAGFRPIITDSEYSTKDDTFVISPKSIADILQKKVAVYLR